MRSAALLGVVAAAAAAAAAAAVMAGVPRHVAAAGGPCHFTFTIGRGGSGYPELITMPGTRSEDCTIRVTNDDVTEHGLTPLPGSLSPHYFGGEVMYPSSTTGLGSTTQTITVGKSWPDGTYPYYCIFHNSESQPRRGKIVLGSGVCTSNCLPTDAPTPAPPLPCAERCDLVIPPPPTCEGDTVLHPNRALARCDTTLTPSACVYNYDREVCSSVGKQCADGQCVAPGGASSPQPPFINECFDLCLTPPAPDCLDAITARSYAPTGECRLRTDQSYRCRYSATLLDCTNLGGACADARCVGTSSSGGSGGGGAPSGGGGGASPSSASGGSGASPSGSSSGAGGSAPSGNGGGSPSPAPPPCFASADCQLRCATRGGTKSCGCRTIECHSGEPIHQEPVASRAAAAAAATAVATISAALVVVVGAQ